MVKVGFYLKKKVASKTALALNKFNVSKSSKYRYSIGKLKGGYGLYRKKK
jgi:hypothetical protein